jgi:hypothetical protein
MNEVRTKLPFVIQEKYKPAVQGMKCSDCNSPKKSGDIQ